MIPKLHDEVGNDAEETSVVVKMMLHEIIEAVRPDRRPTRE